MTRVAVIADSHFDEASRFDECVRVHRWIADDLRERRVDLVLHSGDVFERKSTPRERAAVADWLRAVADVAPVVIVRGNHDAIGDLPLFSRLRTRHPILVEEAASVRVIAGVAVACVAWPRKAEIAARAPGVDPSDALRLVLRGLGQELAEHTGPRVLLSHAMVRGSMTSTGQPLVGCDMELGLEDLRLANADAYALGHIHMPQAWGQEPDSGQFVSIGEAPIIYPGSPRRTAFGEVEEKGYVLLRLDDGGRRDDLGRIGSAWERVATPCTAMVLLESRYDADTGELVNTSGARVCIDDEIVGAEIRFRYEVVADHRAAARMKAEAKRDALLALGAAHVKVEEVVTAASAARAPEVAKARTLEEKLRALWAARGDVDEDRAARLVARAIEIEEAAA